MKILTYESAIQYFVNERPHDPRCVKGAILYQPDYTGAYSYVVCLVFLDRDNQLIVDSHGKPYGVQYVTNEMDKELKQAFGDKQLILVE